MPAKAVENYSTFLTPSQAAAGLDRHPQRDRRSRTRIKLHWPVLLGYPHGETLESITEDLSSQGFYCFSRTPVPVQQGMFCWLTVPTHDPSGKTASVVLECRIRVVRSDVLDGRFGVACHIEEFNVAGSCGSLPF
jgi:hypothetical protein